MSARARPPLSCRTSPPQGGRSAWGRPFARPNTPAGLSPSGSAAVSMCPGRPGRTGRLWLPRKVKYSNDTRRRPVRRFLPRDFGLSAAPALAGEILRRARLLTGGRPHTLDNPVLPPCHATQALPARCQGRQGLGPSKAQKPCPHVARGRPFSADPGERLSRPSSSPGAGSASPQRLVVYPRRNGVSLGRGEGVGKCARW